MRTSVLLAGILLLIYPSLNAQFTPGSIYREYTWIASEDGEGSMQPGKQLLFQDSIDLVRAEKAELILEYRFREAASLYLGVSINGSAVHSFAKAAAQPLEIPIGELNAGKNNRFALSWDSTQRSGRVGDLLSAVILRVSYFSDKSAVTLPVIVHPNPREIPENSVVSVAANPEYIAVDYALEGTDTDWGGIGNFHGLHWQTLDGKATKTLGSSRVSPDFPVTWNTAWLPDQRRKMTIYARAKDREGLYHVGEPLGLLELASRDYGVALITPTEVPGKWATQLGTFSERLALSIAPEKVRDYQLIWTSWSPAYANGLYLNGHLIWMRSEGGYNRVTHELVFSNYPALSFLQSGLNILATGQTPPFQGKRRGGMEVQWPGIMMKIRY